MEFTEESERKLMITFTLDDQNQFTIKNVPYFSYRKIHAIICELIHCYTTTPMEPVGFIADYEDSSSLQQVILNCCLISRGLTSISDINQAEIMSQVEKILINIYSPYSYIDIYYSYDDSQGVGNTFTITLIGFDKKYFNLICSIIGHSGFMSRPGYLNYSIRSSDDCISDFSLPPVPPVLKRHRAHVSRTFHYREGDKDILRQLFSIVNPLWYTQEEIEIIVNNFYIWDRIKFLMMAAERIDKNNMLRAIPHDLIRVIADYL